MIGILSPPFVGVYCPRPYVPSAEQRRVDTGTLDDLSAHVARIVVRKLEELANLD